MTYFPGVAFGFTNGRGSGAYLPKDAMMISVVAVGRKTRIASRDVNAKLTTSSAHVLITAHG